MIYLLVQFKQKGISIADAKALNEAIVPVIDAQSGFISKMWLGNDDTGEFAGVYQFETKADAQDYIQSEIIEFLKSLSTIENGVDCKIYEIYREQYKNTGSV